MTEGLSTLTKERQTQIAIGLAKHHGKDWDSLSREEKQKYMIEATFCVSWLGS